MKPSYEDLEAELSQTKVKLSRTRAELNQTKAELSQTKSELSKIQGLLTHALQELARLKEQVRLNSKNSSKPPSTDQKSDTSKSRKKKREKGRKGIARKSFPPEEVDQQIGRASCRERRWTEEEGRRARDE